MKQPIRIFTLVLILAASISSCAKKGCTDPDSIYYDDEAKKDDGSCLYRGEVIFWYNKATQDSLWNRGYYSEDLYFVVDGSQIQGSYWGPNFSFEASPVAPECPARNVWFGIYNYPYEDIDMGSSNSKNIEYQVLDLNSNVIFQGTKTVLANTCNDIELKF